MVIAGVCALVAVALLGLPYSGTVERTPPEGATSQVGLPPVQKDSECDPPVAQFLGLADYGFEGTEFGDPILGRTPQEQPPNVATFKNLQPYCRTVARYRGALAVTVFVLGALLVFLALREPRPRQELLDPNASSV
jgi:hypothetical protein